MRRLLETFKYESLTTTKGAIFGIDASYTLIPKKSGLSIHIQPNWSNYKRTNKDHGNTYTYRLQAINLPILLRYTFTSGKIRPFAEAELNIRYRTDFKVKNKGYLCELYGCANGEKTIDLQPQTTQDIVGIVAGAGVEFEVGKIVIPITIRLNEGIGTYKMKELREDSYYYYDIKTSNIQITTGITF
ncbi:outer membrane beta-barrel protein [Dyadobacter frigoris]|uniref:PorT family protein n=1 Tax=Dyadobacter frigoris TaxID=2576211 RepID=A0A4U6D9Q5_9BACT|nr:outer membrane beta-barrel protein [Dyadobacter frigoris]TKT90984.1 hypothetical protein FDK13_18670 [Dyadobacter frigoris]GLU56172.1 hypothetical protein Dfri01_56330 [Dyadobacter frigoris]